MRALTFALLVFMFAPMAAFADEALSVRAPNHEQVRWALWSAEAIAMSPDIDGETRAKYLAYLEEEKASYLDNPKLSYMADEYPVYIESLHQGDTEFAWIDLNQDGKNELLVYIYAFGHCGSAGCQTYIFEDQDTRLQYLGNLISKGGMKIGTPRHQDYATIYSTWYCSYWTGDRYKTGPFELIDGYEPDEICGWASP